MKKIKCKAVFFDLWDTLVSSFNVTHRTQKTMGLANYSFNYFIKRFEKAAMTKKFGSVQELFASAFSEFGAKPDKKTIKGLALLWKKNLQKTKPFPEATPVLRELKKRGFKLAIVSNCQSPGMRATIKRFGFYKIFDSIQLSFEAHSLKPEPKMFQCALEELGIKPQDAIMAGDSTTDLEGARNAKMRAILVQRKHGRKKYYKAVAVISSLSELLELLEVEKNGNN